MTDSLSDALSSPDNAYAMIVGRHFFLQMLHFSPIIIPLTLMGLYRTITPWALRGIKPQNVNWTQATVYVPVFGVMDFSYATEFGPISFIAAALSPSRVNRARVNAGFVRSSEPSIRRHWSLSLSILSFTHTHYLKQTSQITTKCSKTERRYVTSLHSWHPAII
jgi:hypothetical protein